MNPIAPFQNILKALKGRNHRKYLKKCAPAVRQINEIEKGLQSLSADELKAKTQEFMSRHQKGETLEELLPEAFAVVKNGARRLCGETINVCDHPIEWQMIHYDVQLIGGMALHDRHIAEMATGEGKTLVSTCPLYLNALSGKNCQLVTVNDYLARRDSHWMGALFEYLGLSVGCIQNNMPSAERREMYTRNITYGTASEFGFDYLRDNGMATCVEDQVQKDHYFCIIDEADSILVDEARTPLIISGPMREDHPLPFMESKPLVTKLFDTQLKQCNRLAEEAKKSLEMDGLEEEAADEATAKLYQLKRGMPTHRQFMRLMEDAVIRKRFEKFDLDMNSDYNKERAHQLKEDLHYVIDEKNQQADLTEKGRGLISPDDPDGFVIPDLATLYVDIDRRSDLSDDDKRREREDAEKDFQVRSERIHTVSQLLRAYGLYEKDKQYVVQGGKVMIVDENTGRLMPGRRWSNGLHQAVEAKEGVTIEKETKTYATITIQNYFRMYDKLAGMTGTAETEAGEFHDIYRLGVMVIPTHRNCVRKDLNDLMFKSRRQKFNQVLEDLSEANKKGQPVLIGTASVESSEVFSRMLKRANIRHTVLNAKFHEKEAEIVAQAGQRGAVTIATNMAGRGTDIKLGEEVKELGGLLVLGTERHESRRIDRQLRGRCARQGDPGASRFYVSLEDDLMRLFANQGALSKMLEKSFGEDEVLEHGTLDWSIQNAQKKVEQQNYSIRKRLLQYDDVLNRQREIIYSIRNDVLLEEDPSKILLELVEEELDARLEGVPLDEFKSTAIENMPEMESLVATWVNVTFPLSVQINDLLEKDEADVKKLLFEKITSAYEGKRKLEDPDQIHGLERYVVVNAADVHWQDHLTEMEELRRSVGLRGYGQKDPLSEYKNEAFRAFEEMMKAMRSEVCSGMFRSSTNLAAFENMLSSLSNVAKTTGPDPSSAAGFDRFSSPTRGAPPIDTSEAPEIPKIAVPVVRDSPKVGRNDPCPCGNGKKYKKCCGRGVSA
ncbi:MAG: preprotein translocase subunit SecA [Opitutae bacterium]|nr:preprotein translocase subunit SecA [Opitutae bacterium]|tara:strand:- start:13009 stop:16026 length:3018 start_codon:yes stop_codon:yes gene_type:complete